MGRDIFQNMTDLGIKHESQKPKHQSGRMKAPDNPGTGHDGGTYDDNPPNFDPDSSLPAAGDESHPGIPTGHPEQN